MKILLPVALCCALAPACHAQELRFPFPVAEVTALPAEVDSYDLPVGPWDGAALPVRRVEGMVTRRAFRLDAPEAGLLEVLAPLRAGLEADGWQVLFDCETRGCGGFDFRFATEVLPEPAMHVDLGEFRFLSAVKGEAALGLLVSRSAGSAFVQAISVGGDDAPPPAVTAAPTAGAGVLPAPTAELPARLGAGLPAALDDLVFDSGSAALAAGDYASLAAVAGWLAADPGRRIVLVGHTDGSGGMAGNIALSRQRAEAVRAALIEGHGVPPGQLTAEGVGPLAPRADNLTEAGRRENRRVEAVPAPTQ